MPHISAYQCISMAHITAHLSCLSVSPISASVSSTYQCCQSVPPISAMPISATYKCPSLQPISANHCSLISADQRRRKITYLQNFI
ncbi:unnamed protein product, partial [Staurois parvus]